MHESQQRICKGTDRLVVVARDVILHRRIHYLIVHLLETNLCYRKSILIFQGILIDHFLGSLFRHRVHDKLCISTGGNGFRSIGDMESR